MAEGLYCFTYSVIYTAVIGWQEVIIININGSLLEGGMYIFASMSLLWLVPPRGSRRGGEGVNNLRMLKLQRPFRKAKWCGFRLDSSGWWASIASYQEAQQTEKGIHCWFDTGLFWQTAYYVSSQNGSCHQLHPVRRKNIMIKLQILKSSDYLLRKKCSERGNISFWL